MISSNKDFFQVALFIAPSVPAFSKGNESTLNIAIRNAIIMPLLHYVLLLFNSFINSKYFILNRLEIHFTFVYTKCL